MIRFLILLLALLLPLPVAAQDSPSTIEGTWALQIGPATIFSFEIEPVEGKAGEWRGTWSRPHKFATDGNRFSQMVLPARVVPSMAGIEVGEDVELSFDDPRPEAIPDIFSFRLIDVDAVEMTYVGTGLAPYTLNRVGKETPLGPFEAGAVYDRVLPEPRKPEPGSKITPRIMPKPMLDDEPNGFRLPPNVTQGR